MRERPEAAHLWAWGTGGTGGGARGRGGRGRWQGAQAGPCGPPRLLGFIPRAVAEPGTQARWGGVIRNARREAARAGGAVHRTAVDKGVCGGTRELTALGLALGSSQPWRPALAG